MKTAVERLAEAVGYPEKVPEGCLSFTFQVDGGEIVASVVANVIRLVCRLDGDASQLPRFAEYAAGRLLREDATLAWGVAEGLSGQGSKAGSSANLQPSAFLWQEMPATADAHSLRRFFETFADSCDWWRARLNQDGDARTPQFPEMMIRP